MPTLKYIIDDGGDNSDGLTWATAFRSVPDRIAYAAIGSDEMDVIGHNSVDAYAYGGNYTLTARTSKPGWHLVSVTQGTGSIAGGLGSFIYQRSTSLQINPSHTTATYNLTVDGSHGFFGVSLGGAIIELSVDGDEGGSRHYQPHYKPNNAGHIYFNGANGQLAVIEDAIYDGALTSSPSTTQFLRSTRNVVKLIGGVCVNMTNRSVFFLNTSGGFSVLFQAMGVDFNTTWATTFEPTAYATGMADVFDWTNCKMPATWTPLSGGYGNRPSVYITYTNCGNTDSPSSCIVITPRIQTYTTPSVYRTGGASFEGVPCSWGGPTLGLLTSSTIGRDEPSYLLWVPVYFDATGSKTITAYYASNTSLGRAYYAGELGFQVMYPATASSPLTTFARTIPARTTEGVYTGHSDDTSVWVGDTFTYKRKIELAVTIGKIGIGYVRWMITSASIAASDDTYLDPQFTVT